jgi:hypothetical protein
MTGAKAPRHYALWNAALAICITIFFVVSVWLIGIEAGFLENPGGQAMANMELANMMAVGVCLIELYRRYRETPDKLQFLRKNWVEIIVLLPFGLVFRAARIAEGIPALRIAAPLFRLEEMNVAIPGATLSFRTATTALAAARKWLTHGSVIKDFFKMAAGAADKLRKEIR